MGLKSPACSIHHPTFPLPRTYDLYPTNATTSMRMFDRVNTILALFPALPCQQPIFRTTTTSPLPHNRLPHLSLPPHPTNHHSASKLLSSPATYPPSSYITVIIPLSFSHLHRFCTQYTMYGRALHERAAHFMSTCSYFSSLSVKFIDS